MRRLAVVFAGLLVVVIGLLALRSLARARAVQLFHAPVSRVSTSDRRVALTFDDGPTPAALDTLLDILSARDTRATFFVTGRELQQSPAAARRIVAQGHQIGNHSYSHRRLVLVSPATIRREVETTDTLIRAAGYQGPIYFRPPYGYKLVGLPWYLWRTRRTTVMWDIEPDSYPEVAASPDRIVRHVLARVRPGSIILLHVWYPSRATSLAAVGMLIDSLHARGYTIGTVGDLLLSSSSTQSARPDEELKPAADGIAAGSRPSPAALLLVRRSVSGARWTADQFIASH